MLTDPKKEVKEEPVVDVDIDLSPIRKKRFRINGDNSKILELNTSDLNIILRLNEVYPQLETLANDAISKLPDDNTGLSEEDFIEGVSSVLKQIDNKMRELMNFIFDAPVSEICAPDGSMYDPFNGKLRYEHILETISALYENNFNAEVKKMTQRVNKHTSKYTKAKVKK